MKKIIGFFLAGEQNEKNHRIFSCWRTK